MSDGSGLLARMVNKTFKPVRLAGYDRASSLVGSTGYGGCNKL